MASDPKQRLTVQEYLAFERDSELKHDYWEGEVFAMSGASRRHGLIAGNLFGEIRNQLKGRPCEVFMESLRVRTPDELFTYPDIVAVCGELQFHDSESDTLLNPTVILEVLSPSTEAYDRGLKSIRYRALPSLAEYVLVAQDRCHVEHLVRQPDGGHWLLEEIADLSGTLELPTLGCRLPLAEIYERVFPSS